MAVAERVATEWLPLPAPVEVTDGCWIISLWRSGEVGVHFTDKEPTPERLRSLGFGAGIPLIRFLLEREQTAPLDAAAVARAVRQARDRAERTHGAVDWADRRYERPPAEVSRGKE